MDDQKVRVDEVEVTGEKLVSTVKHLIHEGNIRRIAIKNEEGKILMEIPLLIGVVGAALLPLWAAIGALAALMTKCTLILERVETKEEARTRTRARPGARRSKTARNAAR